MSPLTVIFLICSLFYDGLDASSNSRLTVASSSSKINHRGLESSLGEDENGPIDRLSSQDPQYLEYLRSRRSFSSSSSSKPSSIFRQLARPDFMETVRKDKLELELEDWIYLRGTTIWEAVRIIESSNFDGTQFVSLKDLPGFYLNRRLLIPFNALLRRFKFDHGPFSNLVFKFIEARCISDPTVDDFFKILVETQSEAFEVCEWLLFESWLRSGPDAWRFLKFYFEISSSASKSESLASILVSRLYAGPVTSELIKYILSFKNFDPNTKIEYVNVPDRLSSFFHILVLEWRLTRPFLYHVLKDPRLDVNAPTGEIILNYFIIQDPIILQNRPIIFLAAAIGNIFALKDLIRCDRLEIHVMELIYFVILHMLTLLWMSLKSKFQERSINPIRSFNKI